MGENIFNIIDIGETYIKYLKVNVSEDKYYICQTNKVKTLGFRNDGSVNKEELKASILLLLEKAKLDDTLTECIISLPNRFFKVYKVKESIGVGDIVKADQLKALNLKCRNEKLDAKSQSIGFFTVNYYKDGNISDLHKILNKAARTIGIEGYLCAMPRETWESIRSVMSNLNISITFALGSSIANASAILKSDELSSGAVIVDVGGSGVSVSLYSNNCINEFHKSDKGMNIIVEEIAKQLTVDYNLAENILNKYANGLLNNTTDHPVFINNNKSYTERELCNIIDNCFNLILKEAKNKMNLLSDHKDYPVILTGGAANIYNICEKFSNYLNVKCEVRELNKIGLKDHSFDTAVGAFRNFYLIKYKKNIIG